MLRNRINGGRGDDGGRIGCEKRAGKKSKGRRKSAARAIGDAEVAGSALWARARVQSGKMGFQDFWRSGSAGEMVVEGVPGAATDGSDFGFSLRDALEPAGQSVEGCAVYGCAEAGTAEAGSEIYTGAGGRRLHGECTAGRSKAAECAVCIRTRRRSTNGGPWRAAATDCAAPLCVEEREMGARIHAAGSRPTRVLGAERVSRLWRSVERATVLWKLNGKLRLFHFLVWVKFKNKIDALLVRGRSGSCRIDFNAPFEVGTVFDADARGGNVSDDGAVPPDVDAAERVNIADYFSVGDHIAGVNFGCQLRIRTDRELVAFQKDWSVHDAVNLQVFVAIDLTLDLNR